MPGLQDVREVRIETPFGDPSDAITLGTLSGVPMAFLPRHGRGHRLTPTEVPARANIYALKSLGVEWVIAVSAVGSLREDYAPLDLALPDQLFDRTKARPSSFFEGGVVAHVSFAEPFCPRLGGVLWEAMADLRDVGTHRGGTYVCIEGPAFSTKAESRIYRSWGVDVIGMTNMPEAKLAREAELCYATLALATDYDVWHASHEAVTVDAVIANLLKNVATAKDVLRGLIPAIGGPRTCECPTLLQSAVITGPAAFPLATRRRLDLLIGKYFPVSGAKPRKARRG
jgi:5'-methylthioadenosine phosphorylase